MNELTGGLFDTGGRVRRSRQRLAVAMALSSVVVAIGFSLLRFLPGFDPPGSRLVELQVKLQQPEPPDAVPESAADDPPPEQTAKDIAEVPADEPVEVAASEVAEPVSEPVSPEAPSVAAQTDWYADLADTAAKSDEFKEKVWSMSPKFDELRRIAAIRYTKPKTGYEKPIWENVEKDQLGRTILRYGDFHRVLEDTSVANQWAHENFTQYLIFYTLPSRKPKMLPWVDEIVARYDYLQDKDFVPSPLADQDSGAYLAKTSASVIEGKSPANP